MSKSNLTEKIINISKITFEAELKKVLRDLAKKYHKDPEANLDIKLQSGLSKPSNFVTFEIARYSNNAAQVWANLRPKARQTILKHIRNFTGLNESQVIFQAYQLFAGLASIPNALQELSEIDNEILENQEEMIKQLDAITERLDIIESKIDEQTLITARKSLRHLFNAVNSDVKKVRSQQLQLATHGFSQLIELEPNEVTRGLTKTVKNESLIVIGYWGNHLYFAVQKDFRNALLQVYECTSKYPVESLSAFSASYYSRDYQKLLNILIEDYRKNMEELRTLETLNSRDINKYHSQKFWQTVKGMAGLISTTALGGSLGQPQIGFMAGVGLYQNLRNQVNTPSLRDTKSIQETLNVFEEKAELLLESLLEECVTQQEILQNITLDDLLKISK
jgi:hypothetical protein